MPEVFYDVVIVGAGLLGAATGAALAESDRSILLLEARKRGHDQGSSHGRSRIIRTLASETPVFTEMARYGFDEMRRMQSPNRPIVRNVEAILIANGGSIAHRQGAAVDLRGWGLSIPHDQVGILDPIAGVFDPEALLGLLYRKIEAAGRTVWFETGIADWSVGENGVTLNCRDGRAVRTHQLVIAAGAWLPEILEHGPVSANLKRSLAMRLDRIPLFYFDYPAGMKPLIAITLSDSGEPDMYAMPEFDPISGEPKYLKVGFHKGTRCERPDDVSRTVHDSEIRNATRYMEKLLGRPLTLRRTSVCLYAMAADRDLPLIGRLPGVPRVYMVAYGGGVCAKHALALGRSAGCELQGKRPPYDLSVFRPERVISAIP